MRDEFRKRLRHLTIKDLNDPNRNIVDPNEGDKEFRKLMNRMIYGLTVKHVQPEEIVIMQSDSIFNDDEEFPTFIEDKAKFYIILNGNFKVSSLRFNKRNKK